jgi:transcriptional regulator with XRE-family HTH domain
MKENINLYISTNLQYLRKTHQKTQRDIGNLCNKTDTAVSNWEKGIREPDATDLGIIANYFNTTVDDLMFKDLRFNNTLEVENDLQQETSQLKQFQLLYDKVKDLPEDKQKIIVNVTQSVVKEIDEQLDRNE